MAKGKRKAPHVYGGRDDGDDGGKSKGKSKAAHVVVDDSDDEVEFVGTFPKPPCVSAPADRAALEAQIAAANKSACERLTSPRVSQLPFVARRAHGRRARRKVCGGGRAVRDGRAARRRGDDVAQGALRAHALGALRVPIVQVGPVIG